MTAHLVFRAVGYHLAGHALTLRLVAVIALAGALAGLIPRRAWRVGRLAVTAVHEGGHAAAAVLAGRKVAAIHLRPDTSGVTVHRGSLSRRARLVTAAAGYPAPGGLGMVGAWLIAAGHGQVWLVTLAVLGGLMTVLWVRNLFGLALMAVLVSALAWLLASGTAGAQALVGAALAWYLTIGGVRAVVELFGDRAVSDATDMGRIVHLPAAVCKVGFAALAGGALAVCALLLLGGG